MSNTASERRTSISTYTLRTQRGWRAERRGSGAEGSCGATAF